MGVIPLMSLWASANAETLIWREFAQLGYIFEFLIETHRSNPYAGKLSEFSFVRDFPRVTEERYSTPPLSPHPAALSSLTSEPTHL
jgi:hypothetical protein